MDEQIHYKRNYTLHWIVLLVACGLAVVPHQLHWRAPTPFRMPAAPAAEPRVQGLFIIHMPEITTQHESGVGTMKERVASWIEALKAEGFHPMLLSEALALLESGRGVPPKTVVTVFDPGYRHTYEVIAPIFAKLQWPAVWLSDETAMQRSDRRYITFHTAHQMQNSGLWDVGFQKGDGRIQLHSRGGERRMLGDASRGAWSALAGAFGYNAGPWTHDLNMLTVNSAWLAPELVNRLRVEMPPLTGRMALGKGTIQGREWGLSYGDIGPDAVPPAFDMKAPLNRRGSRLFFLGTKGIDDFRLHVECQQLIGEFWVQLRVDDVTGYAINIIYTDHAVFVVQQVQNAKTRLFFGAHSVPASGRSFIEDVTVHGTDLDIAFNNSSPVHVGGLEPPTPGHGILQLYIADKLHGTARADGVQAEFMPLPHS